MSIERTENLLPPDDSFDSALQVLREEVVDGLTDNMDSIGDVISPTREF